MAVDKQHFLDVDMTTGLSTRSTPILTSTGVPDSGKLIGLDGTGKLDVSFMPTGIGPTVFTITASENLAAGDYVNIFYDGGAAAKRVRRADATSTLKYANGFVKVAVTSGNPAVVYTDGVNDKVSPTGLAVTNSGVPLFLSITTPGGVQLTSPSASTQIIQVLGYLVDYQAGPATCSSDFMPGPVIAIE